MATGGCNELASHKIVDSAGIHCPLCLEVYRDPRALSCLHTYCCDCIHSFVMKMKANRKLKNGVECPLCRNISVPCRDSPPEDWAKDLPTNYAIASFLQGKTKEMDNHDYLMNCLPCRRRRKRKEANIFCPSCNEYQCRTCASIHDHFGFMMDHELVDIKKAKMDTGYTFKNLLTCQYHGKDIEYYCPTHDEVCCTTCAIITHRKCKSIELKNAKVEICYDELKNSLDDTEKKTKLLSKVLSKSEMKIEQDIHRILGEMKQKRETALKKLEEFEEKIRNQLFEEQRLLRAENREMANKSIQLNAAISGSMRMLESIGDNMQSTVKFVVLKKLKDQNKMFLEENQNIFNRIYETPEIILSLDNCTSKFCSQSKEIFGGITTLTKSNKDTLTRFSTHKDLSR